MLGFTAMTDVSIKVATPSDAADTTALLEAVYPVLMQGAYDPVVLARGLPLMTRANPALLNSGSFYLATGLAAPEPVVAGCGGWTRERPGTGEVEAGLGHIRHFATHPDWTGRGIAKSLLDRCVVHAPAAGVRRLECYSSLNAEGFYAAFGFAAVRPMDVHMGTLLFPSILMTLDL